MSNSDLQTAIGRAVTASYAASTIVRDDVVFADFERFVESNFGYALAQHVDYFNADRCRRHRAEAVAGYLATVRESSSASLREPFSVLAALRRAFRMHALLIDAFEAEGAAQAVVRGLRMLVPPVPQPRKVGVTESMIRMAQSDALGDSSRPLLHKMLGLAALYAYVAGARASEFCATSLHTRWGRERNKHTILRNMTNVITVAGRDLSVEVFPRSSKTTGYGRGSRSRPTAFAFCASHVVDGEAGLGALLCGALAQWLRRVGGAPSDPLFSFREDSGRLCSCTREDFSLYTKTLASLTGLDPVHYSSKSWKVARVSHGVVAGESAPALLARGNHRSVGANQHYRPGASLFGAAAADVGISTELALDEARRDDHLRRCPSPDASSDSSGFYV
jgi:hypothetical protein